MFVDEAEIYVKAGKGGDGAVSFRREKYIPNGGPDGGDGGKGGDIIFSANNNLHGLFLYNRQKRFLASDGQNGMGKKMHGKNGDNLVLEVPVGTQIYEKENLIQDMTKEEQSFIIAKGGNGGWGNQHFATSIKQAPKWAKEGFKGESHKLRLVLKTIADIGLIGLPNSGKSTLLSVLTSARPKIADYPFTTLEPNLGTYIDKGTRLIIADIPGLIEGASSGKGLGVKFLRHIERTKIIIHILDANSDAIVNDYKVIRKELVAFSKDLANKIEIVVVNKIDSVAESKLKSIEKEFKKAKINPLFISAVTHQGLPELVRAMKLASN